MVKFILNLLYALYVIGFYVVMMIGLILLIIIGSPIYLVVTIVDMIIKIFTDDGTHKPV